MAYQLKSQARRTNSSSPLGLLFDHGVDALTFDLGGKRRYSQTVRLLLKKEQPQFTRQTHRDAWVLDESSTDCFDHPEVFLGEGQPRLRCANDIKTAAAKVIEREQGVSIVRFGKIFLPF